MELEAGCTLIIQKSMLPKTRDPSCFTLSVTIEKWKVGKVLLDIGASINFMLLSMIKRVGE